MDSSKWILRIFSAWLFLSALYVLLFISIPSFVHSWFIADTGGYIFTPEQIGVLIGLILILAVNYFLGKWCLKYWIDIPKRRKR